MSHIDISLYEQADVRRLAALVIEQSVHCLNCLQSRLGERLLYHRAHRWALDVREREIIRFSDDLNEGIWSHSYSSLTTHLGECLPFASLMQENIAQRAALKAHDRVLRNALNLDRTALRRLAILRFHRAPFCLSVEHVTIA
jgi:hypothetical protein